MPETRKVIITPGRSAGIDPGLVMQLAQRDWPVELVIRADGALLTDRVQRLGLPLPLLPYDPMQPPIPQRAGTLTLLDVPLNVPAEPGVLNMRNGAYVVETLAHACGGCLSDEFAALVTGPVHKGNVNDTSIAFAGHTEFFEKYAKAGRVVMVLATEELRTTLMTTHLPLKAISEAITPKLLREIITILDHDLRTRFGVTQPHVLVCGLNPHADESGHMGTEEIDTIIPVLEEIRAKGVNLSDPLPTDTLFQPRYLDHADMVFAMYHDQGLPVLEYRGFGRGVDITLGLPFICTSVDHGTALELAGQGKVDADGFITILNPAVKMVVNTQ